MHPPPSFWSTSGANKESPFATAHGPTARAPGGGVALNASRSTVKNDSKRKSRLDGSVTADTVCSALRARGLQQRCRQGASEAASVGEAVRSSSRGKLRSRRDGRRAVLLRKRRVRSAAAGREGATAAADRRDGATTGAVGSSHGRFSPKASLPPSFCTKAGVSPRSSSPGKQCWVESATPPAGWKGDEQRRTSPSRILPCESKEEEEKARMLSPGREGEDAGGRLRQAVLDAAPASPSVSPRRRTTVGCGGAEAGLAFVEIQRDLLSQLEGLFVTIADDRRHGLAALKREEAVWRANAKEEAKVDLQAERAALERRAREKVLEEGPGSEAREAVGLVPVCGSPRKAWANATEGSLAPTEGGACLQLGGGRGGGAGWRLPTQTINEMRHDFAAKMERESAEVLEEENKALLEAREGLARREGARTERELQELSDRLTNDGRDALAALQLELESDAEVQLDAERQRLKEGLACALERERKRLTVERRLRIIDAQEASGREWSERAAAINERVDWSNSERRYEAVRLLDDAAARARSKLEALLSAQEQRGLEEIQRTSSTARKALLRRVRKSGERDCLKELAKLADGTRKKNEAWLRLVRRDIRDALGETAEEKEGSVPPVLQLRAVEASEDCARLGRRLVDVVQQEARMRLQESFRGTLPMDKQQQEQQEKPEDPLDSTTNVTNMEPQAKPAWVNPRRRHTNTGKTKTGTKTRPHGRTRTINIDSNKVRRQGGAKSFGIGTSKAKSQGGGKTNSIDTTIEFNGDNRGCFSSGASCGDVRSGCSDCGRLSRANLELRRLLHQASREA